MKRFLIRLASVLSGFALSRLLPVSARPAEGTVPAHGSPPASAMTKTSTPTRVLPPDSFSLEGEWQPQAKAWAERNPAEFYQWLVERGIPPGPEVLQVLFQAWIRQDVDAAFTAAFNLPGDFQRQDRLLDVMLGWILDSTGGLQAALPWIRQVEQQVRSWSSPGGSWMRSAPPEEIAALLASTVSGEGYSATMLEQFTVYWAKQDRPAVQAWLAGLDPSHKATAFKGLMTTWAETDPNSALDYLATEASSSERSNAYLPLAELAKKDPVAALNWWENNLGVPDPNSLSQIFLNWNSLTAGKALDYILTIEDPSLRRQAVGAWGGTASLQEMLQTFEANSDPSTRQGLLGRLVERHFNKQEEQAAIRRLVADPSNPDITPEMAANVSTRYAYQEPQAALNWVATLPEALQANSAAGVVNTWNDKVAAAQAVENLPPGPAKTAAQQALKPGTDADPFR